MGKTGRNESTKLTATLLNNCAVGLLLAGFFLPVLTVYYKLPEIQAGWKEWLLNGSWSDIEFGRIFAVLLATVLAVSLAAGLHIYARDLLGRLED
jgi:hypothetical protein